MFKFKSLIIILLMALVTSISHSKQLTESQKIDWLIDQVKDSELVFLRNGNTHSAANAAKHLKFKIKTAKKMFWFFGPEKKFTVDDFINKIASKSSSTGKLYKIRLKNGLEVTTKNWLNKKLKELQRP